MQIISDPDYWDYKYNTYNTVSVFDNCLIYISFGFPANSLQWNAPGQMLLSVIRAVTIHQSDVINKIRTTTEDVPVLGLVAGIDLGLGVCVL